MIKKKNSFSLVISMSKMCLPISAQQKSGREKS
jgi:hypothetical protein